MKKAYCLILAVLINFALKAQVGIGTTTPSSHAVLELRSPGNNQGLLVPRLTTAQRVAIALTAAENGMLVFDSDEQKFFYWQNPQWLPIRTGVDVALQAGAGITITGNTISAVADGDGDAANEIQDLQLNGNTLTITNNPSATSIDLAPFSGTNTDNQTLSFNASTGVLSITGGNTVTVTPTGVAGGVLTGSYPSPGLATSVVANANLADNAVNAAKIADGTITTNDLANSSITSAKIADAAVTSAKLSTTGVAPNTYGSATLIPQLTVDAQGRITGASTISLGAATPTGAAGGALSGTYPSPSLASNAGDQVVSAINNAATTTQIATARLNTTVVLDTESPAAASDLSGSYSGGLIVKDNAITTAKIADGTISTNDLANASVTSAKLSNTGVAASTYGSASLIPQLTVDAQGRVSNVTQVSVGPTTPSGAAGGALAGTYPSPTIATSAGDQVVGAINNAATTTQIATARLNTAVVLDTESPAAASDLSGSYSGGLLVKDNAITASKIADGSITTNDLADASVTSAKLSTTGVSPNTYGTATVIPQITVDAQGRITSITTVGVGGAVPSGAAGGALAGTYPSPSIATSAGDQIVSAINNAVTTSQIAATRLNAAIVLDTESPVAASEISGSYSGGLVVKDNAITTAKVADNAITSAKLNNSGATAGTYGSSSIIPVISVDAKGRVTSVSTASVATSAQGLAETLTNSPDAKNLPAVNLSNVSIGTSSISGALNVIGSHYVSFTTFTGDYTVQPNDYILIGGGGAKPTRVTLPSAKGSTGRVLIIRSTGVNQSEPVIVSAPDGIDGAADSEPLFINSNFSDNTAYSITIISDGNTWITIDRGIGKSKG